MPEYAIVDNGDLLDITMDGVVVMRVPASMLFYCRKGDTVASFSFAAQDGKPPMPEGFPVYADPRS